MGRARSARARLAVLALLGTLVAVPAAAREDGETQTPIQVVQGATQLGDLVAMSRSVEVRGNVDGSLVSLFGDVTVEGRISGDMVLLGGRGVIRGPGRVDGRVLAFGGDLTFASGASPSASIGGRLFTISAMETEFLAELRTSPLVSAAVSPLLLSLRLFVLAIWLAAGLALLFIKPRRVACAADHATRHVPLLAALGAIAFLTGLLLSTLVVAVLPARLAVTLVLATLLILGVAKAFGLAALFLLVGRALTRGVTRDGALSGDPAALSIGLLVLGAVSLLPLAGPVLWWLASLVAIGLAFRTAFGRPEGLNLLAHEELTGRRSAA